MPSTPIDYKDIHRALNASSVASNSDGCIISTPFGLSLLEIQGELNLPESAPTDTEGLDPDYVRNFAKVDDIYEAVKFGRLEFDEKDQLSMRLGLALRFLKQQIRKRLILYPAWVLHVLSGTTDLQLLDYYRHFQCYDFQGNYLSWNLIPRRH